MRIKNKTQAARLAVERGEKRFIWVCLKHGMCDFFTSNKTCILCSYERKDPAKQAEVWARWIANPENRARHLANNARPNPINNAKRTLMKETDGAEKESQK